MRLNWSRKSNGDSCISPDPSVARKDFAESVVDVQISEVRMVQLVFQRTWVETLHLRLQFHDLGSCSWNGITTFQLSLKVRPTLLDLTFGPQRGRNIFTISTGCKWQDFFALPESQK